MYTAGLLSGLGSKVYREPYPLLNPQVDRRAAPQENPLHFTETSPVRASDS